MARESQTVLWRPSLAIRYATLIMVVAVVLFQIFPAQLLGIFQASPEMLAIGVPALRILSLCFLIGGFTIVASSVFQALGKGLLSMSISVFRQLILVLPAGLCPVFDWGTGTWSGGPFPLRRSWQGCWRCTTSGGLIAG